jgi:hypothetical protein
MNGEISCSLVRAGTFFQWCWLQRTPARGFAARFILPTHAFPRYAGLPVWLVGKAIGLKLWYSPLQSGVAGTMPAR